MADIDSSVYMAKGSFAVGDVTIGRDCGIWYNAVVRGDEAPVRIGERSNVQDNAVLHVDAGMPLTIGKGVTIGHGAIVHSCTIGDDTLIGMGAIILNRAKIGSNCIIGAGSLVTQGTEIPDNSVAFGNPAKVRKEITPEAIAATKKNADVYVELAHRAKVKE